MKIKFNRSHIRLIRNKFRRDHSLLAWIMALLAIYGLITGILLNFISRSSLVERRISEVDHDWQMVALNSRNADDHLSAVMRTMYSLSQDDSFAAVTTLETTGNSNDRFISRQNISRMLRRILSWNPSLSMLFF